MHRKTNSQTVISPVEDRTEYIKGLFSKQCLHDNGHRRKNNRLHSTLRSRSSSTESIDYPLVANSNYPPVKSKTTQIAQPAPSLPSQPPILYRTSELITSNLRLENWFHNRSPINNEPLTTATDDSQLHHFGLCCAHMVGFVAVLILLSQYFGVRIVEKLDSTSRGGPARSIFDVLVDPINIDAVFEFNYIDEYVKKRKHPRSKVVKQISTVVDNSGWNSVSLHQSFRHKSDLKRDGYLKKRKCTSVGPVLLEIELPAPLDHDDRYDVKEKKKSNQWKSTAENKSFKCKESDGNSTTGSYTTSYVCVIFISRYFFV